MGFLIYEAQPHTQNLQMSNGGVNDAFIQWTTIMIDGQSRSIVHNNKTTDS